MPGESTNVDLKLSVDFDDPKWIVELVKDFVAIANSGGGSIFFGRDESSSPGVTKEAATRLDGAEMSNRVNRYIAPTRASISHHHHPVDTDDKVVVELTIEAAGKYPYVFSRQGNYKGATAPVFRECDLYVRHGAKSASDMAIEC